MSLKLIKFGYIIQKLSIKILSLLQQILNVLLEIIFIVFKFILEFKIKALFLKTIIYEMNVSYTFKISFS